MIFASLRERAHKVSGGGVPTGAKRRNVEEVTVLPRTGVQARLIADDGHSRLSFFSLFNIIPLYQDPLAKINSLASGETIRG